MTETDRPAYLDYYEADVTKLPPFAPGTRSAKYPRGISFRGPWEDPFSGFHEHGRRLVEALTGANLPVKLFGLSIALQLEPPSREAAGPWVANKERMEAYQMQEVAAALAEIIHIVPSAENFFRWLPRRHPFMPQDIVAQANRCRVISTVLETRRLPGKDTADTLKRAGQVWVASRMARRALIEEHGLEPDRVVFVPIPFTDDDPLLKLRGKERLPGPPRFYHIGKWEPRKAQDRILAGFLLAFEPGQAKLTIKTSSGRAKFSGYPRGAQKYLEQLASRPMARDRGWTPDKAARDIHIIDKVLPAQVIEQLHAMGDVYVTLSRGEGYDMPAFDAKLAGNLMVHTPSGGPQDFATPDDPRIPASGWIKADSFYNWGDDAEYLDFKMGNVVSALREAHAAVLIDEKRVVKLAKGRSFPEHARAATVGADMRAALERLNPAVKELAL